MIGLLAGFFSSFIVTLLIIRFEHMHSHLSADSDLSGPQKFHKTSVPRIGRISIAIGLLSAVLIRFQANPNAIAELILLVCAIPTFAIGLTEDLTKKISVRMRLIFTAIGALLAIQLLDIRISSLDFPIIDHVLGIAPIAIAFTVFAIKPL